MRPSLPAALAAAPLVLPLLVPAVARADERRFTFTQEAPTAPKGAVEFENWFTYKKATPDDSSFNRFEFRHELEFGLTDHVQLAFYIADWSITSGRSVERDQAKYDDSALELKINFMDPAKDGFGLTSYHEVRLGDAVFELENKLILQKNFGPLVAAYNLSLEAVWQEHGYREREGELSQSLGLSYEITPKFLVGMEALHELPLPDWKTGANQNFFIGPVASYRFGGDHDWWVTATALKQTTHNEGEAEWQFRVIVGFSF
ncbi:MAG TPA: hypothetical protein PKE29_02880 [Phycisphaerales bacterium]|mgnify:CR=1 FL=1|nr:hypothetical protein [Phycisphaerales bacterium]